MLQVADALDEAAIDALADRLRDVGPVTRLAALPGRAAAMHHEDMATLVAQARELLEGFYVHLPLKRALYAVDPIGRLDLLDARLAAVGRGAAESLDEDAFHEELGAIFAELRDLHTTYTLPDPYRRRIAFLPFLVEECSGGRDPMFVLTKTVGTFADQDFAPSPPDHPRPVVVTHWNGVPIARAVMRHAARTGGSNDAARRARGVERLTFRWLGRLPRPEEDWVVVTYEVDGERRHLRFEWLAAERPEDPAAPRRAPARLARGADEEGQWLRRVKQGLFATPGTWDVIPEPGVAAYREFSPPDDPRRFGHLRLFSFDVAPGDIPGFVRRVARVLRRAPADGLVVDLRGNPGGDIGAAEQLLQLISPVPIQPLGMDFINTRPSRALARQVYLARGALGAWDDAMTEAASVAAQFLPSPAVDEPRAYNALGQAYHGPVALLVDALSYSAADVFAASFQDHDLGTVVGTDPQTGGGGGNVWPYESIRALSGHPMPAALPHGATFDVAVRRTTRVAGRAGTTLEDRGVVLGAPAPVTPADLLGGNERLLADVATALAAPPWPCRLEVAFSGARRCFTLRTEGLARVDIALEGRPPTPVLEPDGARVPLPDGVEPTEARFLGYAGVVASRPVLTRRWKPRGRRGTPVTQDPAPAG